ncbi:sigma-70 family RNA polymerase sigma factor [Croceicoccus sp. BE223]|uniref:sigma-70 family RNA polymerase sigma factor n=1 Tax=Croceicoccus sp. BE223 TaxID=2817716 RepID=UPI002857CB88|nr:sigma-70 family RNA polymerase sigma factor [Croceicoccus sp. BE223]MDR7102878.1 RNA polymerase sigma-70 factor (ECF subfamily) [Croceicoccus sp. BE223]
MRTVERSSDSDSRAALATALGDVAAGDRAALRTIFNATSPKLLGICLRVLKDREEAEDALQDVFVSVWQRASSFDPAKASAITWLATIARNRSIDRLRSRKQQRFSAPLEDGLEIPDDAPDAFTLAADGQGRQQLKGCIAELENRAQSMIRAAFFDGLAYSQLAERAGVPLGTLKGWMRRGLRQLRECLQK